VSADETTPDIRWDELVPSADFHDVGHFTRGEDTRVYRLRVLPDGAELWRITETPGEPPQSIRETHFRTSEEAGAFLEEMQRALKAGGWREG
jgi:hypothetical protein